MIEDKLTAEQRIRLESVAQAQAVMAGVQLRAGAKDAPTATTTLLTTAATIAAYVAGGHGSVKALRAKVYVSDEGALRCNDDSHECDGMIAWPGRRMDVEEVIATRRHERRDHSHHHVRMPRDRYRFSAYPRVRSHKEG
jgi:hypothetical protein